MLYYLLEISRKFFQNHFCWVLFLSNQKLWNVCLFSNQRKCFPVFQKKSRFDDDVLCIVQDETSFSKFHVNLPRSTSILDLYKRAADEFGYKQDSFLLVLKHTTVGQNEEVQEMELLNWTKILTLGDVCQPPPKRKHRFFLRRRAMNIVGMNNGGNP